MNREDLAALSKVDIPHLADKLTVADIGFLVEALSEKADMVRYHAFLLLQEASRKSAQVHEHWGAFERKLGSDNSYQRSIGIMLLADNVRWDTQGKFQNVIGRYLACCADEKFVTSRQAIQGLARIVEATDRYDVQIKQALAHMDFGKYKESQQSLLQRDVQAVFAALQKRKPPP